MSDPWRERTRGGHPDPALFGLGGAEQLHAMLAGDTPQPPISRLTGMRLTEVGDGTATFEMPLTRWLCAAQGTIGIGPLVVPADAAMACAIQSALGPLTPFSTSELTLRLLAPARPGSTVRVRGRLIQLRRTLALADGEVHDETGRLIAHGSTLCFIQPSLEEAPASDRDGADRASPADPSPDPWERPASGEVLGQELWERMSGLEVLEAQLDGELPAPPIHHLTGLTLCSAELDRATFAMPASPWLCAPPRDRVQGGGIAILADAALNTAVQTGIGPATALAPVDLKLNYLRPLAADGRTAVAHGSVVHRGRRIAVADSRVLDADGRTIVVATGSAIVLAGRPAALGAAEA